MKNALDKFCVHKNNLYNMWRSKNKNKLFKPKVYKIEKPKIKYKNPLSFKKGIFKLRVVKIVNLILLLGILGCFYFFIFSPFYDISEIIVSGNKIASTEDILEVATNYLAQNRAVILKNRNIFLLNEKQLTQKINELILLDNLEINKRLPNTIRLTLTEKDAAVKWLTNNESYLIDSNGQIIKKYYKIVTPDIFSLSTDPDRQIPPLDDDILVSMLNLANQPVNLGDKVLNPQNMTFIKDLLNNMAVNGYKINKIEVPNNFPQYLSLNINEGWLIHFSLNDTLAAQLARLNLLIDKKINKSNLIRLEYIDLRLGESIYYKFKGQEQIKP